MKTIYEICGEVFSRLLQQVEKLSIIIDAKKFKKQLFLQQIHIVISLTEAFIGDICRMHTNNNIDFTHSVFFLDELLQNELSKLKNSYNQVRQNNDDIKAVEPLIGIELTWKDNVLDYLEDWKDSILEHELKIYKKIFNDYRNSLQQCAASKLIGEKMSPFKPSGHGSASKEYPIQGFETYTRSDKHPSRQALKSSGKVIYSDSLAILKNGGFAHVGSYGNMMQAFGDIFTPSTNRLSTTDGDAKIYQLILIQKINLCDYIASQLHQKTQLITVSFYHQYPCLMIHIHRNTAVTTMPQHFPADAAFKAWVNFLISYLVGLLNADTYLNGWPIEIERRASFGFLSPTIAPTGTSIRISMGLVPKVYADILIENLIRFDQMLVGLSASAIHYPLRSYPSFYHSSSYRTYMGDKYPLVEPVSIIDLLWIKAEKAGKTLIQNIVRTAYARQALATLVFNKMIERQHKSGFNLSDSISIFYEIIAWSISKIYLKNSGKKTTLTFHQGEPINENEKNNEHHEIVVNNDIDFWSVIETIYYRAQGQMPHTRNILHALSESIRNFNINKLYLYLDCLTELMFISSIESSQSISDYGDGYGSDSEEESEVESVQITSKKIITHSGMRAILCAVTVAAEYFVARKDVMRLFASQAYYEVPMGLQLIKQIHQLKHIVLVKNIYEANAVIYDLNMCLTKAPSTLQAPDITHKMLFLDATSALSEKVHQWLKLFAAPNNRGAALFIVESGAKNQQLGADKNQYGVVRVMTKNPKLTQWFYQSFKKIEPPLLSKTSHQYRRYLKNIGAAPVTRNFFIDPSSGNRYIETINMDDSARNTIPIASSSASPTVITPLQMTTGYYMTHNTAYGADYTLAPSSALGGRILIAMLRRYNTNNINDAFRHAAANGALDDVQMFLRLGARGSHTTFFRTVRPSLMTGPATSSSSTSSPPIPFKPIPNHVMLPHSFFQKPNCSLISSIKDLCKLYQTECLDELLTHLVLTGNEEHLIILLKSERLINLNMKDDDPSSGKTALHHAAKNHISIYHILLAYGACDDYKDADGHYARDYLPLTKKNLA
jgi:hypothetical protein